MPVQVAPAGDADMPRIFDIAISAFQRNEPLWDTLYPFHWTEAGRKKGVERMLQIKTTDPNTIFLKAFDDETGEIMGMAKWLMFTEDLPASREYEGGMGDYWENEAETQYAKAVIDAFVLERNQAIERSDNKLVSLDILTVDPRHQRKKVGDALVKWGTQKADEMGVETIVESSVCGKGLYEKNGFVFQKNVDIIIPPPTERQYGSFAWLVRPRQKSAPSVSV